MGNKRFRTQRVWHNTLLVVWSVPFVLLPGVIAGASNGRFTLLQTLAGLLVLGLAIAMLRDRRKSCLYVMEDELLALDCNGVRQVVPIAEVADASLIDRSAAREYMLGNSNYAKGSKPERRAALDRFTKYCTVDIGLVSYTLGLGRSLIDRLPSAKRDLVLIRMRNGEPFVLSPLHSQEFVESIGRRKMNT